MLSSKRLRVPASELAEETDSALLPVASSINLREPDLASLVELLRGYRDFHNLNPSPFANPSTPILVSPECLLKLFQELESRHPSLDYYVQNKLRYALLLHTFVFPSFSQRSVPC